MRPWNGVLMQGVKALHHKVLASEVLGLCFEHYSLHGAVPQMNHNELG